MKVNPWDALALILPQVHFQLVPVVQHFLKGKRWFDRLL
jgi:hypothetical protein